jgi:hypothetical protein
VNAKPNAMVTTDIDAHLMPGSVAIVRDADGVWLAFAAVPAEVNGDTDMWVRIDTALRQVGWSTVGVDYIAGPGIAEFTAEPATDVVWRRRTRCNYQLKPGDRILRHSGIETVTHVGDSLDEGEGRTYICTDLDPSGGAHYPGDQVTVLVPAGNVVAGEVR